MDHQLAMGNGDECDTRFPRGGVLGRQLTSLRLSRRRALQALGTQAIAIPSLLSSALDSSCVAEDHKALNQFPRMMQEYFVSQARRCERRHLRRLENLKTKADAEGYVQAVKRRIRRSFGAEPRRTPLNARIVRTVEREGYRVENVIFESRPGFPVTANLYIPTNRSGPRPAVVGTCGHSTNGKAAEPYQAFSQGLARLGYVCLIYDPIGQGERLQYVDEELSSQIGIGVREHLHAGNQQFLVGEFLGMWRAWDGIRALDYLLTRPEVDKSRVGVTGNSGGGTMTTWLCGVEPRWSMAAPSCFVTTFRRNLENELPQDTEQCPPLALALGLDHFDFLVAMAPKPVVVLAKEKDYFDVRGAEETYHRLREVYRLLNAEDNVGLFVGPSGHGYSQENREAMYSWFNRASKNSTGDEKDQLNGALHYDGEMRFVSEPKVEIEDDETLWCAPQGQVARLTDTTTGKAKTVFSFTSERSRDLTKGRRILRGQALQEAVSKVLRLPKLPAEAPDFRNYRYLGSRNYPTKYAMGYFVETEPGIHAVVYRLTEERWHSRPSKSGAKAMLYVSHRSSDNELRDEPLIRELLNAYADVPLFTCDLRGIGESLPQTCNPGSFDDPYGSDYFYAIHSLMLDRPYVGQKCFDLLRVVQWLEASGHSDLHVIGRGWGALPTTFASVLSHQVKQVTLKHALTSYADLAETEHYDWPLSTLVPNILKYFDLPDCYDELAGKALRQLEPWGPKMKPVEA